MAEEQYVENMSEEQKRNTGVYVKNVSKIFKVPAQTTSGDDAGKEPGMCDCCKVCSLNCCCPCLAAKMDVNAVRNVSMVLDKGEVLGLLGANGAGKTTIFLTIQSMGQKPDSESLIIL